MKKILSLFLCVCIFLSLFSVISYAYCEICNRRATADYFWRNDYVIVTIKKGYKRVGGVYYPSEFSAELVNKIIPRSFVKEGKEDHPIYNADYYRDIIMLFLKEPSEENCLLLIELLKENPIVENAQRVFSTNAVYPAISNSPGFSTKVGDADCDYKITAADARMILRFSVGLDEHIEQHWMQFDVDFNNKITAADARIILRYSVGLYEYSLESLLVKVKDGYIPENYDVTPEFFGNELIARVEYIGQDSSFCVYLNAPGQKNLFELKAYLENSEMIEYTEFNYIGYLA